ncbi:hypothetical protein [Sinimarinibacterium flocculans]|uniref:Uncharacterized protein n=1 Tax=Sinimarinibacterium flocculans TaxID=985250 RepID=A0A318E588_9GAMM|nr:hypothetical protein [Sinimarinibacterium flocculans]PXV66442.1 hypothetical protein C8D93_1076 [Sinimarinibacterium flocculans]
MSEAELYTRQSTLLVLSRTRTGRLVRRLVAMQARKEARTKEEARLFAGATGYLTLEKMVMVSNGKLPWAVADSVLDFANGHPRRVFSRIADAVRGRFGKTRK